MLWCRSALRLANGKMLEFSARSLEEVTDDEAKVMTYDELKENYLWCKEFSLCWLKDEVLIASCSVCDVCQSSINWVECNDRSDVYVWECHRQIGRKRH